MSEPYPVGATSNSIRSEMGCRARCPGVGCGCGIGGTSTGGGRGLGGTGDGLWIGPGSGVGPGTCTPKAMTAPLSDRAARRPALVVFSILVETPKRVAPMNQFSLARSDLTRKPEPTSAIAVAGRCFHGGSAGGKHRAET